MAIRQNTRNFVWFAFKLRLAFLLAIVQQFSCRHVAGFAVVAMVLFWLGAGAGGDTQKAQTLVFPYPSFVANLGFFTFFARSLAKNCAENAHVKTTGCIATRAILPVGIVAAIKI
jgi:hypothetical protein